MLDLMHSLRAEQHPDEFLGLALADDSAMSGGADSKDSAGELGGFLRLEDDASATVMAMMMPSTLSEVDDAEEAANESESDSIWSTCLMSETDEPDASKKTKKGKQHQYPDAPSPGGCAPIEPLPLDDVVAGELSDEAPDEVMMMIMEDDETDPMLHVDGMLMTAALGPLAQGVASFGGLNALAAEVAGKKRRGRKPSLKPKAVKPKRPPPSAAKARLRSYERRSRHKRERTMLTMKENVELLESRIRSVCGEMAFKKSSLSQQRVAEVVLESIVLNNHNYHLRKAIDDHRFFHSMIQLEYDHRETTKEPIPDMVTPKSWRPLDEAEVIGFMRDSFLEIDAFSTSEDFISSGLEICGWREKRKLVGHRVNFLFHKQFATDCSDELAARSWEMRAVQDQVTRYFGHSLDVQVEVIQRFANDVVVVRRKITHTVDGWVHHTIYLLFRTKTPDGHLVCIRDMNPEDEADDFKLLNEGLAASSMQNLQIWSKAFVWWKFTALPEVELDGSPTSGPIPPRGFEVEYGGSLSNATQADAAFWMREVLILALRWENLVVGPLLTL